MSALRPFFEPLETRRMLATHVFSGTFGSDTIIIDFNLGTVSITVNATTQTMLESSFDAFVVNALDGHDAIDIHGSPTKPLTISGGAGNDTIRLTPITKNLSFIKGPLTLNGDAGTNAVFFDDFSNTADTSYALSAGALQRTGVPLPINLSGFANVTLQAGQGADTIDIRSTAAGASYIVNGGTGAAFDDFRLGSFANTLADLLGALTIDAQDGPSRVTFLDHGNDAHHNYAISPTALQNHGSGLVVNYANIGHVVLNAGGGANAIDVEATVTGMNVSVLAGGNNDLVRIAPTSGNFDSINSFVSVDGQDGADHVEFHDAQGTNEFYQVHDFFVRRGSRQVDYARFEQAKLFTTQGGNWIDVHSTAPQTPVFIDAAAGQDIINVLETAPGAPVTLAASSGEDTLFVNATGAGHAEVVLDQSHALQRLSIDAGGLVRMTQDAAVKILKTQSLEMQGNARLDLANNALAWDFESGGGEFAIDEVRARLASGYANGTWSGDGIFSSTAAVMPGHALGYAVASDLFSTFPAPFAGHSIADGTTVLVRFTRTGDANLDGTVNLNDFNRVAANFGAADKGWSQGNFNYDAAVNLSDFNLLASNFGQSVTPEIEELLLK